MRNYKVFEVTTKDFGKGYIQAGSSESAFKKAEKRTSEKLLPNMTSYYDRGTKEYIQKKYGRKLM